MCVVIVSNLERDLQSLDLGDELELSGRYVGIFPTKLLDLDTDTVINENSSIILEPRTEFNLYKYHVPHMITVQAKISEKVGSLRIFDLGSILLKSNEYSSPLEALVKLLAIQGTEGKLKFDTPLMKLLQDFFVGSCMSYMFFDVNSKKLDDDELQSLLTQSVNYRVIRKVRKMNDIELAFKTYKADCERVTSELKNVNGQLASEASDLKKDLAAKEEELSNFNEIHKNLLGELEDVKAQLNSEVQSKSVGIQVNEFEQQLKIHQLRTLIADNNFETAKAACIKQQYESKLQIIQLETKLLVNAMEISEGAREEQAEAYSKLKSSSVKLTAENAKAEKEKIELKAKISTLSMEKEQQMNRIAVLESEVKKFDSIISNSEDSESKLTDKIEILVEENKNLKIALTEAKDSLKSKELDLRAMEIHSAKVEAKLEIFKEKAVPVTNPNPLSAVSAADVGGSTKPADSTDRNKETRKAAKASKQKENGARIPEEEETAVKTLPKKRKARVALVKQFN